MPDDRLAAAVAELYEADPEVFTERRAALSAQARKAGDRAAAKAISGLRRPTRAAWVVNRLARADPSAPSQLAELGGALRAAQEAGHGPRLRELSAARGALVDALTAQALGLAGVADPPPSLRLEVSETLGAALADPGVAEAFASGTLTKAAQWSGFGALPMEATAAETAAADTGTADSSAGHRAAQRTETTRIAGKARPPRQRVPDEERLAREAAEREAHRREAEGALAAASGASAAAAADEDRLEAAVREQEQRLTQARADLAAARSRARHAEAAERRARQALERLSGE